MNSRISVLLTVAGVLFFSCSEPSSLERSNDSSSQQNGGMGAEVVSVRTDDDPSSADCGDGEEDCACYGNRTCNSGLSCLSALCVKAMGGEGGSGGGDAKSGEGSSSSGGLDSIFVDPVWGSWVDSSRGMGGAGSETNDEFCPDEPDGSLGSCDWMRVIGTNLGDGQATLDSANGVAVDEDERNIYVVGQVQANLQGVKQEGSRNNDAYLRKYDEQGKLLWSRQFGTAHIDSAKGVAVDVSGDVFVVGAKNYNQSSPSPGGYDSYLAKFDGEGTPLLMVDYQSSANEGAAALAIDSAGNVAVVGKIGRTPVFEEESGFGGEDFTSYVQLYRPNGELVWTRKFESLTFNQALGVAVDNDEHIIVAGVSRGPLDEQSVSAPLLAYVRRFDPEGNPEWAKMIDPGSGEDMINVKVAADSSGHIFVMSSAEGLHFYDNDEGDEDAEETHSWIAHKWDVDGNELWAKSIGVGSSAGALSTAPGGELLLTGRKSYGNRGIYVVGLTVDGELNWNAELEGSLGTDIVSLGNDAFVVVDTQGEYKESDGTVQLVHY